MRCLCGILCPEAHVSLCLQCCLGRTLLTLCTGRCLACRVSCSVKLLRVIPIIHSQPCLIFQCLSPPCSVCFQLQCGLPIFSSFVFPHAHAAWPQGIVCLLDTSPFCTCWIHRFAPAGFTVLHLLDSPFCTCWIHQFAPPGFAILHLLDSPFCTCWIHRFTPAGFTVLHLLDSPFCTCRIRHFAPPGFAILHLLDSWGTS